jgi:hypothetical protein
VLSQPVRASVCALYCALSACSENAQKGPPPHPPAPKYSLDRPAEGLPLPAQRDAGFRRGVSLDLFLAEVDESKRAGYGAWLDQVARLGATDLELVVQWSQLDAVSPEIAPSATMTVEDNFLGWLMDQANQHQLRVIVTPVIELEQPQASASRALQPADTKRWFWNYHRFLLHYARIAEAHQASCFSVGADLPDALLRDEAWPGLIKDVRKAYKGKLGYVARWDSFETVPFWDNLEEVGLAGTSELWDGPARADRDQRVRGLMQRLRAFGKGRGRSYLLSRVVLARGTVREDVRAAPATGTTDARGTKEQLDATRALYQGMHAEGALAGLFVTLTGPAASDKSLTAPVTSASAEVLRHWYTRSRVSSATAATLH